MAGLAGEVAERADHHRRSTELLGDRGDGGPLHLDGGGPGVFAEQALAGTAAVDEGVAGQYGAEHQAGHPRRLPVARALSGGSAGPQVPAAAGRARSAATG